MAARNLITMRNLLARMAGKCVERPTPVIVASVLLTNNLGRLLALESCLSGKGPGGQVFQGKPAPPPCEAIARLDPSAVVFGPATFLNQFAIEANKLLGQ